MSVVQWVVTMALGAWLLLRKRVGDRWGWLAMINAWAEWGSVALGALALLAALGGRWRQSLVAALLGVVGAPSLPALPVLGAAGTTEALEERQERQRDEQARFTVFSANLYKRSPGAEPHIALIREHDPDVVCLQELDSRLADEILCALGEAYPYRVWRPEPGAYGFGVLSRCPVEETGYWDTPGVRPWAQRVRLLLPGNRHVEVYNVHLVPPIAKSTLQKGATWGFRVREQQVRTLQDEIESRGLPAFMIGDHNFSDTNDAYDIASSRLEDAWVTAGQGARWTWPTRSFPLNWIPANPPMLRLDYCFHNSGLKPQLMQVLRSETGSDHCPLLVTFTLD